MASKMEHTAKFLEYLSNPDNDWPKRLKYCEILGVTVRQWYNIFTYEEVYELERQALNSRRQRYAPMLRRIDEKMGELAEEGDKQAAKLIYQRLEGLAETVRHQHTGTGQGGAIQVEGTLSPEAQALLDAIISGKDSG